MMTATPVLHSPALLETVLPSEGDVMNAVRELLMAGDGDA
jgi:hypothetical protein